MPASMPQPRPQHDLPAPAAVLCQVPLRSSRSIRRLRIILWIAPACATPFIHFAGEHLVRGAIPGTLVWLSCLAILGFLSHADATLSRQRRLLPAVHPKAGTGWRAMRYFLIQLLIIAALCALADFAFVLLTIIGWETLAGQSE